MNMISPLLSAYIGDIAFASNAARLGCVIPCSQLPHGRGTVRITLEIKNGFDLKIKPVNYLVNNMSRLSKKMDSRFRGNDIFIIIPVKTIPIKTIPCHSRESGNPFF